MIGKFTLQVYLGSGILAEKIVKRLDAVRGNVSVSSFVRRAILTEIERIEKRDEELPQ